MRSHDSARLHAIAALSVIVAAAWILSAYVSSFGGALASKREALRLHAERIAALEIRLQETREATIEALHIIGAQPADLAALSAPEAAVDLLRSACLSLSTAGPEPPTCMPSEAPLSGRVSRYSISIVDRGGEHFAQILHGLQVSPVNIGRLVIEYADGGGAPHVSATLNLIGARANESAP